MSPDQRHTPAPPLRRPTPPVPELQLPPIGLGETVLLLLAVTLPMGALVFLAVPALIRVSDWQDGILYWCAIVLGMSWQFGLATILLLRERRDWTWPLLKQRLWLTPPRRPHEDRGKMSRLLWIVPLGFLSIPLIEQGFGFLDAPFAALLPAWIDPPYNEITSLATPENVGNLWLVGLALVSCLFNYFLGEYLFFHGYLLPRMIHGMGARGSALNVLIFGLYHVHIAFRMPTAILTNIPYILPSHLYRSTWPALIIHALEGVILMVMVILAVMGKVTAP